MFFLPLLQLPQAKQKLMRILTNQILFKGLCNLLQPLRQLSQRATSLMLPHCILPKLKRRSKQPHKCPLFSPRLLMQAQILSSPSLHKHRLARRLKVRDRYCKPLANNPRQQRKHRPTKRFLPTRCPLLRRFWTRRPVTPAQCLKLCLMLHSPRRSFSRLMSIRIQAFRMGICLILPRSIHRLPRTSGIMPTPNLSSRSRRSLSPTTTTLGHPRTCHPSGSPLSARQGGISRLTGPSHLFLILGSECAAILHRMVLLHSQSHQCLILCPIPIPKAHTFPVVTPISRGTPGTTVALDTDGLARKAQ
eukprot:m.865017 g.865017  ORF g.865017 m.865017 type:complete len:305 (-) comp59715_c0_seq2:1514-2428(-)